MPELPEVETVRRGLGPTLVGQVIRSVDVRRPDLRFPFPERFAQRLAGARVLRLDRRAKYLVARLSTKEALIMHLGMTGRFEVQRADDVAAKVIGDYVYGASASDRHLHAVFSLADGAEISYFDPRRFGYMLLIPEPELDTHPMMRSLGVEPLTEDLDARYLAGRAHGRRCDLKAFLLDQRVVAGLGNIYVAEALFRAGLRPSRQASVLASPSGKPTRHAERLAAAVKGVLEDAIAAGGSTLRDYRQADGQSGSFQAAFEVYGRAGEACVREGCGGIVRRSVQGGRSSFHCPACQR